MVIVVYGIDIDTLLLLSFIYNVISNIYIFFFFHFVCECGCVSVFGVCMCVFVGIIIKIYVIKYTILYTNLNGLLIDLLEFTIISGISYLVSASCILYLVSLSVYM